MQRETGATAAQPTGGAPTVLATDLDGTLYLRRSDGDRYFRTEDIAAVRVFQSAGNIFGLCTGRSYGGALKPFQADGVDLRLDFCIVASGALILDAEGHELVGHRADPAAVQWVHDTFAQVPSVIQGGDHMYTFGEPFYEQVHIDSIADLGGNVFGISLAPGSPEAAARIADRINAQAASTLVAYQNVRNVDVVARGVSKGTAIAELRGLFRAAEVAAVGDSYNDLPMLVAADQSFTFESSPEPLQCRVTKVVDSVAEVVAFLVD